MNVVGGPHAALCPSDFRDPTIDLVIRKNGPAAFRAATDSIDRKRDVAVARQAIQAVEASHPTTASSTWELPYREIGRKYADCYRIAIGKPGRSRISEPVASVKTSSGCPFRCRFCCLWKLYPKHETRPVDSVVAEMAALPQDYLFLADDESMIDAAFMTQLADALMAQGVRKKLVMYGRSDTICRSPALIERLAEAGMVEVWIGLEGANDEQLREYRKSDTTTSHAQAIRICKRHQVKVHATALVSRSFRPVDFDGMLRYTRDTLGLTSCHFFVLTPFKGTAFFDEVYGDDPQAFETLDSDHFSIRQSVLRPVAMSTEEFHLRFANLQREFNSDTIPFRIDRRDCEQEHLEEFERFRAKNERLYRAMCEAHCAYGAQDRTGVRV